MSGALALQGLLRFSGVVLFTMDVVVILESL